MQVTMVKKRLFSGEPCAKCVQAEELLRRRELWHHISEVVWADEADAQSTGMQLAREHGVALAPFFIVKDGRNGGPSHVYTSVLKLIKDEALINGSPGPSNPARSARVEATSSAETKPTPTLESLTTRARGATPEELVHAALDAFGERCAIAFSGADDVVLIDMAKKSGLPFSVFCLDTGRLHPETYRFIDKVREHYSIEIELVFPDFLEVERLVRRKGLFSFYEDGHQECCAIRKVAPLKRVLKGYSAWITGQRKDQSPVTRGELELVALDDTLDRRETQTPLIKFNPLANWSSARLWRYIDEHSVPFNELHSRGFVSIGCEPCTRAIRPGEHERAGRWWWEEDTKRECGLHIKA